MKSDLQTCREHPGIKASEMECDDKVDTIDVHAEAFDDRQLCEEEVDSAKLDAFVDFAASQKEEICLQKQAEMNTFLNWIWF